MRIRLRPPNAQFWRFAWQAKTILGVWARFVGAVALISLIFGPFAPLVAAALIFTMLLPIGLLTLWGRVLDAELGWTDLDRWRR